ncbi:flagellar motor switch protein FliN [Buchnera aphidicola]|uniref:Flagellar motor switch protein FliN n=1 Tax=Buchnera aphidicola subsp. Acyrthosiphon pisum (strain 5A) TaxID=563178 RepID=A0A7U3YA15_BUCA5|nr:flagellar motor switch protein FliN [Buchnera aphidicola]ADP66477.1 flagellar motor switch protein FliN [Buchnera aphidicola str. TLW03 (Acyrthosiphon pisum)]ADP67631.1 flagellar motor switch protein FliN [Buchnera aphidicola str. JF98 (Acyrthosiphon pisum)]OQX98774.1 MAG: flagellar motor switch protein FliN [Erwiniaceae bacterium 4572_131]ACL29904.1 flagellar motor switch protein FliN [Buchnera aphidicola str. Tuc7 (Acyrthosiphon pisum)]ACL30457.1 flagellar motor switch protein FliN [Buchn
MSKIQKNSDNDKLIDSEKKIPTDQDVDKNLLPQENSKNSTLDNTIDVVDSKKTILNVPVNITVELGTSRIKIKDFLKFSKGSMLILNESIKEPLNIFMNGHLIASGEIVVLEEKYGIRITNIKNSLKTINISS